MNLYKLLWDEKWDEKSSELWPLDTGHYLVFLLALAPPPPFGAVALLAMESFTPPGKYLDRSVSCSGQGQQERWT